MLTVVDGVTDTTAVARVVSDVMRWSTVLPETIETHRSAMPSHRDWFATVDGTPVGACVCAVLPDMRESEAIFALICVLPSHRRSGIGSRLYAVASDHARSRGRVALEVFAFDDDPDGVSFAERRGFTCVMRARGLRLPLAGHAAPAVDAPAGIEITTLSLRPDLARGIWETAREVMPDIPFDGDVPLGPGTYEEFCALSFTGPRHIPEATFVALDGDEVVGYAQLGWNGVPGRIADHEMLAVRRAFRGLGIATALKSAQIAWAIDHGVEELRTGNEERNGAARAVNAKFPYEPMADGLVLRGPLAPA